MKTNKNLASIYAKGESILSNETSKQGLARVMKSYGSLSQVIKVVVKFHWEEMGNILPSLGIDDKKDLTPAKVMEAAKAAGLTKESKKNGTEICKVCKSYEKEEITLKDEAGNDVKISRTKVDADGNKVPVYNLRKIVNWTPLLLAEVLGQSQK